MVSQVRRRLLLPLSETDDDVIIPITLTVCHLIVSVVPIVRNYININVVCFGQFNRLQNSLRTYNEIINFYTCVRLPLPACAMW